MEMKVNIKRCFYELWKKKNIIALIVLLSILIGVYMMLNVEEVGNYSATASVYAYTTSMSTSSNNSDASGQESSGLAEFTEVASSYNVVKRAATLVDNEYITEDVIQYMYSVSTNGNFLYVNTYADDKEIAMDVANAVAEAFVVEYKNLTGAENVQVFEKAENAAYYSGDDTNKKMTMIIYTGVGFFLICVILVFRVIFSAKVQDYSECNMDGAIEILGVIPEKKE